MNRYRASLAASTVLGHELFIEPLPGIIGGMVTGGQELFIEPLPGIIGGMDGAGQELFIEPLLGIIGGMVIWWPGVVHRTIVTGHHRWHGWCWPGVVH